MKVLITGANGFLGSWLTRRLLDEGLDVRILRREKSDLSEISDLNVEHSIGDITDKDSITKSLKDIDSVFHLAGLIAYTRAQRPLMEKVNVLGTKNVVNAALEEGIRKFVHLSSVTAIGASFDKTPLNEATPFNLSGLNLGYFETKRKAEEIVKKAALEKKLDAVILNPSTIYGPGDAKKGSRKTQLKVAQGRFPFYTAGGVNIVHIKDAVEGIFNAWQRGRTGERYILAGENITIKNLFELIAEKAGVEPPKHKMPSFALHALGKVGDLLEKLGKKGAISSENAWTATLYHWFDSSKAQKELGLKVTPAAVAIEDSIRWSQEHGLL